MEPRMLVRRSEPEGAQRVALTIAGKAVVARKGETVAAAALAAGVAPTRRAPASGAARAPYCMMGACFECLMTIDGRPNRQACMTPVRDGMIVEPQTARPRLGRVPE